MAATPTTASQCKAQLKAKGCPDDCCDQIANHPKMQGAAAATILEVVLGLAAKYGPSIFQDVLAILNGQTPAPVTP